MPTPTKTYLVLVDEILERPKLRKGLSHREASVLLACDDPERTKEIMALAEQIKKDFYGDRIVIFCAAVPVQLLCQWLCCCPYHAKNKHRPQEADPGRVAAEVRAWRIWA